MIHEITNILTGLLVAHYGRTIQKHPHIVAWLAAEFPHARTTAESLYCALNTGKYSSHCSDGNLKSFRSFTGGYQTGCGNACPDSKKAKTAAISKTNIERYGVATTLHLPEVIEKSKATHLLRYGVEHHSQLETRREAQSVRASDPAFQQHISDIIMDRYGVENVISLPEIRDKIAQTNLERYGATHVWASPEVRKRVLDTQTELYGGWYVNTTEFSDTVRNKTFEKYGVDNVSQRHILPEIIEIFKNQDTFEDNFGDMTAAEISKASGYHITHVRRLAKDYDFIRHQSGLEVKFARLLDGLGVNYVRNTRSIISPLELDFYLPDHKIGFELHGLYWHSDIFKSSTYHQEKFLAASEKGIRLVQIFEDEIDLPGMTSMVSHLVGKSTTIYARKTIATEISSKTAALFMEQHHLYGSGRGSVNVGLTHDNVLVGVMSFVRHQNHWELARFATKGSVIGGASKLLAFFERTYHPTKIRTFSDLRYSNGDIYRTLGFASVSTLPPAYFYVVANTRSHRFNHRVSTHEKTERQVMRDNGIPRIYDAGKLVFEKLYK